MCGAPRKPVSTAKLIRRWTFEDNETQWTCEQNDLILNITSRWLVIRSTPREGKRWGPGDQTVWAPPVDVLGPWCNKHSTEEQGKWQTKSALLHNNILLVPHFTHLYSKSNVRRSVTRLTNAIPTLLKRKFSSNFSVKLRKKERRTNN